MIILKRCHPLLTLKTVFADGNGKIIQALEVLVSVYLGLINFLILFEVNTFGFDTIYGWCLEMEIKIISLIK